MTTLSVLELMPTTGQQVETFSNDLKKRILSGELDFRRFLEMKTFIEKTLDSVYKDKKVSECMQSEIEKYGKEGLVYNGLKFTIGGKKTYNYKHDPVWLELEGKKKEREVFLKALKEPLQELKEGGEVVEIFPATFTESTYIKTEQK